MKIRNRLNPSDPCFSFEFFPPKTDEGRRALLRTVEDLRPLDPGFVSVTSGAGGSTQERTVDLVRQIRSTGLETMAHLTCVGHTREELGQLVEHFLAMGVENILALRGDPPAGQREFQPPPGGFHYAAELVRFIRERDH
ncbi:MAG TPA: methylenetetrahydrofolate reductase, partial [Myxococcaceae bacterium]|nr:methylenetetrahydrofolate reductase [Myxococcaceae bacterium]